MSLLAPSLRALAQLDDPAFFGVVWRSVLWALAAIVALGVLIARGAESLLAGHPWLAGLAGGIGALVLAFYFFLPLASTIAMLFVERVAAAVERRCYPGLPPAHPAPLAQQVWDGIALGLRVLAWQIVTLLLVLVPPLAPVAAPLGWAIAAWSVGRGLFVAVAMRRMDRPAAAAHYRARRVPVLAQGALITLGSIVPGVNLLVPVLGTAAMVHVLHATTSRSDIILRK
jgi:CysZ protein